MTFDSRRQQTVTMALLHCVVWLIASFAAYTAAQTTRSSTLPNYLVTSLSNLTSIENPPFLSNLNRGCYYNNYKSRQCFTSSPSQDISYVDVVALAHYVHRDATSSPYTVDDPAVLLVFAGQDDHCLGFGYLRVENASLWLLHTDMTTTAAVLLEDVAQTINSGPDSLGDFSDPSRQASLMACGANGGIMPVNVNKTHPFYSSDIFKKNNYRTSGLLINVENYPRALGQI